VPIYTIRCQACLQDGWVFRKIDDRDRDLPGCDRCGSATSRIIDAPFVRAEIPAYISPATGKVIESRAARRGDLARSGCIEWEPGLDKDVEKNRIRAKEKSLEEVDKLVDKTVQDLSWKLSNVETV